MRSWRLPPWTILAGTLPALVLAPALLRQIAGWRMHEAEWTPTMASIAATLAVMLLGSLMALGGYNLGRLLAVLAAVVLLPLWWPAGLALMLLTPSARRYTQRRWDYARRRVPLR